MMKVISSQRFLDYDIVDEKLAEMESVGVESIILPIINAGMADLEGNDLYILIDGHHRKEAAEELEITVNYEEVENDSNLTGEDLLNSWYMDDNWYYVENGVLVW